jgi:glutathione peroxidase
MTTVHDFTATDIDGRERRLDEFGGQVLLIVNVASQCGFTPQYQGLEDLYRQFHPSGFSILGFPCNQFGGQEPGSESDIQKFCNQNYSVTFPLFAKVEVNGPGTHPLYVHLKRSAPGLLATEAIKWNFTKFLVDRSGNVVKRYGSRTHPEAIAPDVASLLDANSAQP